MAIALSVEFKQVGADALENNFRKLASSSAKFSDSLARSKAEAEAIRRTMKATTFLDSPIAKAAESFERGQNGLRAFVNDLQGGIRALLELSSASSFSSLSLTSLLSIVFDLGKALTAVLNPSKLVAFFDGVNKSTSALFGLSTAAKVQASAMTVANTATQTFATSLGMMLVPLIKIAAIFSAVVAGLYAVYRAFVIIEQETHILRQIFDALKRSLDVFIQALGLGSSASDFFAKVIKTTLDILQKFANYIVVVVAAALKLLIQSLSLLSSFFASVINIMQKLLAVFNVKVNTLNAAKAALTEFSKRLNDAVKSLDDVREKALKADYTLKDFREGLTRTTQDVYDFSAELARARLNLEQKPQGGLRAYLIDLREQIRLFQAEGKNYLALVEQIRAADIAKKIKPDSEDYEALKKLETDALAARAAVEKEAQEIASRAAQTRAKIRIDAEINAGNITKALNEELASDKRLADIRKRIAELKQSTVPEAQELIRALNAEYAAITAEIRAKYANMLADMRQKTREKRSQMLDDLRKMTASELDLIEEKYAADLKKLQDALAEKLITQEEYEQKSLQLFQSYEKQKTDLINEQNKKRLEDIISAYTEVDLPPPENVIKELDVVNKDIRSALVGSVAKAIEELQSELTKSQQSIAAFFDSLMEKSSKFFAIRKSFVDLKNATLDLQKQIFLLSTGATKDLDALTTAFSRYTDAWTQFSKSAKETIERFREVGDIDLAEKLQQLVRDVDQVSVQMQSKIADAVQIIRSNASDFSKALEYGVEIPFRENAEEVFTILQSLNEEINRQMKEAVSVFQRYNFATVEGITDAFNDFTKNFNSISPGKVFSEIIALGFDRALLRDQAQSLGEEAAEHFAAGLSDINVARLFAGLWYDFSSGLLRILSNSDMLIAIADFFAQPVKEFRAGIDKILRNIFYAVERISKNLPLLLTSIFANIPRFVVKILVDVFFRLFPTLLALVPLIINRFIFALAESLRELPKYLAQSIKYAFTVLKSTVIELLGTLVIKTINHSSPWFLNAGMVIASVFVDGFSAYYNYRARRMQQAIADGARALSSVVFSIGNLVRDEYSAMAAYTVAGTARVISAIADFYRYSQAYNKRSIESFQALLSGTESAALGLVMIFGKSKREIAEVAAAITLVFGILRAAMSALVYDYAGAAKALATSMSASMVIIQAAGKKTRDNLAETVSAAKKFNDQFEIKMKIGVEDESEEQVKQIIEKRIEQAKKLNELQNKRVGSAEFKVKDVQDLEIEKQISQLSLSTADAVKSTAGLLESALSPLSEFDPPEVQMPDFADVFARAGEMMLRPFVKLGDWLDAKIITPLANIFRLENLSAAAVSFGRVFIEFGKFLQELILSSLKSLFDFLMAFSQAWRLLYDYAIVPFADALAVFVTNFFNAVADFSATLAVKILELATVIYGKLVEYLPQLWQVLSDFLSRLFAVLYDFSAIIVDKLLSFAAFFGELFVSAGSRFIAEVAAVAAEFFNVLRLFSGIIANQIIDFTSALGSRLFESIQAASLTIGNFAFDLAAQIRDKIVEGLSAIGNIFYDNLILPLINAFNEHVVKPIRNVVQAPANTAQRAGSWISEQTRKVTKWLGFSLGGIVPVVRKLPIYYAASGMIVPGVSRSGNAIANDTVPAMLSPGEVVLPNSVTQRPDLMRDIAAIINGDSARNVNILNVSNTANVAITQNITIDIQPKQALSRQEIEKELAPVIIDAIKEASERGRAIISRRGLF